MKTILKNKFIFMAVFSLFIIFLNNKVYAKSYSIQNMDIQATLNTNGSISIKQTMEYEFNGSYNGVYISIPIDLDDSEYDSYSQGSELNDTLYNASDFKLSSVKVANTEFNETVYASNGDNGVYTVSYSNGAYTLKIFSPSTDITKSFEVSYTLENVAVKHNDFGEVFYNFIGGEWETTINNLNIDFYLPNNTDYTNLYVWLHGPYNGTYRKVSATQINAKFTKVSAGEYVALRTMFPLENISYATKSSGLDAYDLVVEYEGKVSESIEDKQALTTKVLGFAMLLLLYWLMLIYIYEKDKMYIVKNPNDEEMFEKYNPLLAGCIQGSREVLARDIIAVLLNLVDKKIVNLEIIPTLDKKKNYEYMLQEIPEKADEMDQIEKYVHDWFFANGNSDAKFDFWDKDYKKGESKAFGRKVNLATRLSQIPEEKNAAEKFETLNNMAMEKLNKFGANKKKVPTVVKVLDNILFIVCLIVVFVHIHFNGLNIYFEGAIIENLKMFIVIIISIFPVFMYLLYIPIALIVKTRHAVNRLSQKISGQKIISTSISITLLWLAVIILTGFLKLESYLIVDEILLCIGMLIMFTDNLMMKNEVIMIEDFSKLNNLKYKIENYTIMNTRDVEEIMLWDKYLIYAVSFGIASVVISKIKGLNIDSDFNTLIKSDFYNSYMKDDYREFYNHFSRDNRFLRNYSRMAGDATRGWAKAMTDSSGSSDFGSSSGGGRIFTVEVEVVAGGGAF